MCKENQWTAGMLCAPEMHLILDEAKGIQDGKGTGTRTVPIKNAMDIFFQGCYILPVFSSIAYSLHVL